MEQFVIQDDTLFLYVGSGSSKVVVPDDVSVIGEKALAENEDMIEVVLPNSIKYIGLGAFMHCKKLEIVKLPNSL